MDHRRVRTSRLPPLSRREKPCLRAGGCWGGFAGGELFRVGRYVSTGAREVVRDFERKMRHCVRRREKSFSSFLFRFRGNCGKVSPGGLHLDRLPGSNDGGPGSEYADCADCGPRFPPLRPCAPRRATGLPTPIATTAAPARVPPGPGRRHVGPRPRNPSSQNVVTKVYITEST